MAVFDVLFWNENYLTFSTDLLVFNTRRIELANSKDFVGNARIGKGCKRVRSSLEQPNDNSYVPNDPIKVLPQVGKVEIAHNRYSRHEAYIERP
jgi:hypothetical protein